MVSAFWHGFYGGYYLSFILWFFQVFVSQIVFKESKKENSKWVKLYNSLGMVGIVGLWIASNVTFSVSGSYFQILSLKQSWECLKAVYFYPLVAYIFVYFLFTYAGTRTKRVKVG